MYYMVQVNGTIIGNMINNMQIPYQYFGIKVVETLDRDYETKVIYKTDDKFEYTMYLDQPTSLQILEAKQCIKKQMLIDLQKILNTLTSIKQKIESQN